MALYYICIAAGLAAWLLIALGSVRKTWNRPADRLHRLQTEGVLMLLFGMLAAWALFDRQWGIDRERTSAFAYWFTHGERGLFWIGQLLLFMAYFLERRPRPGLRPWPSGIRLISMAGIAAGLCGAVLGLFALNPSTWTLPWSWSREWWSLGLIPFAAQYAREGWTVLSEAGTVNNL